MKSKFNFSFSNVNTKKKKEENIKRNRFSNFLQIQSKILNETSREVNKENILNETGRSANIFGPNPPI